MTLSKQAWGSVRTATATRLRAGFHSSAKGRRSISPAPSWSIQAAAVLGAIVIPLARHRRSRGKRKRLLPEPVARWRSRWTPRTSFRLLHTPAAMRFPATTAMPFRTARFPMASAELYCP